ncbi:uncharacterized protein B0H18DRAFT_1119021 [Fomitopsis serialis]|uniref:uncharacterized protein n=1 Tax=Fomitopsis serialis TaxID=139415 RepID=UPI0020077178|nr:uncharacterized protein B0H18DRAFT_1119021 [Neoantrodia serialis]KAH9926117.1 hypothetical protein B0H18DRAFT_1119021 [Neoantrodia serialis]
MSLSMLEWYSLTRRFSLLRASSGTPIALDDLKSKFAEQRARGSRNQVTEEEEDMILEALGRLHARAARTKPVVSREEASSEQSASTTESQDLGSRITSSSLTRDSLQSSSTTPTALHSITSMSSLSSTKGSNASRRMSNNLFGSGKLRDQTYIRSTNPGRRAGGSRNVPSVAPSDSMMSMSTVASSGAGQSSIPNNDKAFERQRAGRLAPQDSDSESAADRKDFTTRLSKALHPDVLRHASLALDEVIREMEEEGDDEIVMERTTLPHVHGTASNGSAGTPTEHRSPLVSPGEFGTAVSSDDRVVLTQSQISTVEMRSPTSSPAPRLPGYIPGMPRPMTPRESTFDSDDQTPSNTPRATSPRLPSGASPSPRVPQTLSTSLYRSNSAASSSRQSPAPISTPVLASTPPLFFNRIVNGQFTPEDRQRSGTSSPVTDVFESSAQTRRRPMSPLSGPAYQALANNSSRSTTPSNVTKNGSTVSVSDLPEGLERAKSTSRSMRSPALPESPLMDRTYGLSMAMESEYRPPSAMSGMELGSPLQINNRPLRSPTPTHSRQKSPTVATFPEAINGSSSGDTSNVSRRSSKQNHHSSFSLGSSTGLLLSPIANSSRSSIESAGSSYHSWDEDHRKDRLYGLFSSLDPDHTEWHDVPAMDKSASSTPGTSPYESLDMRRRQLVKAAIQKVNTPDGRARANSLRRRRPSTSQSNYSLADNRVASPAPHVQPVVNAPEPVSSSPVRRHKALADALFGQETNERPPTPSAQALLSPTFEGRRSRVQTPEAPDPVSSPPSVMTLTQATSTMKSPVSPNFSMSQTNVSHVDAARLAMEVQQRAEAATAALRKSPSIPKMGDSTSAPSRKRINPRQISSPKLVSSSNSLNTIPLPASHKVSRFRKLTGTLRAKDIPPSVLEQRPPASAPLPGHLPHFSPTSGVQSGQTVLRPEDRDHGKTSSPDPSPPASASPGLRSFISRFRKPRASESYSVSHREKSSPSSTAFSPSSPSFNSLGAGQPPRSAPALQTYFEQPTSTTARVSPATATQSRKPPQVLDMPHVPDEPYPQSDDAALKQLFAAASDLGLDQTELQSLLARSPSTSSKLTRATSLTENRKSRLPGVREDVADRSPSPPLPMGRSSVDGYSNRPSQDGFRPSMEEVPEITLRPPREESDATVNPIVRRTIIFPSDPRSSALDLNALMRKQSAARKRRSAGATSTYSNRSIHERVPTPPPHKHTGRRFSTDGSPPVPQLPLSIGSQSEQLVIPGQLESSNSAYDSLCTPEKASLAARAMQTPWRSWAQQADANSESGPALELIELANGEMIWNIVNGLRDDDGESFYGDRSSFVSEYSRRDSTGEGLRLFFKGHEKKGSKGSNFTTSTRKRPYPKPAVRPETKVFFSSSAQIGQLIDNLSRGVDAGSFNIAPESSQARLAHSASSSLGSESELRWTLEERRLQQLLGTMESAE